MLYKPYIDPFKVQIVYEFQTIYRQSNSNTRSHTFHDTGNRNFKRPNTGNCGTWT